MTTNYLYLLLIIPILASLIFKACKPERTQEPIDEFEENAKGVFPDPDAPREPEDHLVIGDIPCPDSSKIDSDPDEDENKVWVDGELVEDEEEKAKRKRMNDYMTYLALKKKAQMLADEGKELEEEDAKRYEELAKDLTNKK